MTVRMPHFFSKAPTLSLFCPVQDISKVQRIVTPSKSPERADLANGEGGATKECPMGQVSPLKEMNKVQN